MQKKSQEIQTVNLFFVIILKISMISIQRDKVLNDLFKNSLIFVGRKIFQFRKLQFENM